MDGRNKCFYSEIKMAASKQVTKVAENGVSMLGNKA